MLITSIYRSNTRLHDPIFYKFAEVKGVGKGRSVGAILIAVGLFLFPILSIKLVKLITHIRNLSRIVLNTMVFFKYRSQLQPTGTRGVVL